MTVILRIVLTKQSATMLECFETGASASMGNSYIGVLSQLFPLLTVQIIINDKKRDDLPIAIRKKVKFKTTIGRDIGWLV